MLNFAMGLIIKPLETNLTFDLETISIIDYIAKKKSYDNSEVDLICSDVAHL